MGSTYKRKRAILTLLNAEHLNPILNIRKLSFYLPMIIPRVLAALCSAFQPFEGRVEPAPFYILSGIGLNGKRKSENTREKKV